jgi:hypothetical protein
MTIDDLNKTVDYTFAITSDGTLFGLKVKRWFGWSDVKEFSFKEWPMAWGSEEAVRLWVRETFGKRAEIVKRRWRML